MYLNVDKNHDFVSPSVGFKKEINSIIIKDLENIVKLIVNDLSDVISIYLIGGMARGEGTVLVKNERFDFISDYDIFIVTNSVLSLPLDFAKAKKIENKWNNSGNTTSIELGVIPLGKLANSPKRVMFYEWRENGLLLWGEDVRERIPISSHFEIEKFDGVRTLFNRIWSLLYLSYYDKFPFEQPSDDVEKQIFKECTKIIFACCDLLLLMSGDYKPNYTERNKIFQEVFSKKFPDLFQKVPALEKYVLRVTKWKLNPNRGMKADVMKFWFDCQKISMEVLRFYYKEGDLQRLAQKILREERNFSNSAKFFLLSLMNKKVFFKHLFLSSSPANYLRVCLGLAYFSIRQDGSLDDKLFSEALRISKDVGFFRVEQDVNVRLWLKFVKTLGGYWNWCLD